MNGYKPAHHAKAAEQTGAARNVELPPELLAEIQTAMDAPEQGRGTHRG